MTLNPFLASAGLVAGVLVLERLTGTHVITPHASAAGTTAMGQLKGSSVAGVTFEVPDSSDPIAAFVSMRRALIAKFGQLKMPGKQQYPDNLGAGELLEVIDTWLAAYRAGRDSGSATAIVDFNLIDTDDVVEISINSRRAYELAESTGAAPSALLGGHGLSSLGKAVVDLLRWRRTVAARSTFGTDETGTIETFDRVLRLATELAGVSFTFAGARPSEQGVTTDDIARGLAQAGAGTAKFVAKFAGDAAGAAAGAVVDSSLFWAAALGLIVWRLA